MARRFLKTFCFLFLPLLLSGCGRREPISKTGFYFDTIITVTLYDSSKTAELEHCFALADTYEQYFSAERPDSDVSKINAAGGTPVSVHDETIELLQKGIDYSELSGGRFDITIGRLTDLWDFHAEHPAVPDETALREAVSTIDYRQIKISGNEVALQNPDAAIDLGGIAKGYIADRMKAYLKSEGITSGLINLGGNVLAIGEKPDGSSYRIAIQKPFGASGEGIAALEIKDDAVVSSGTYERYFTANGKQYHHILDASTGYPCENGLCSVSIICKNSADADGLSTTCFLLGAEKGMELIESLDDTEAVFITDNNDILCSSGMDGRLDVF